jgi:hypothetical protein
VNLIKTLKRRLIEVVLHLNMTFGQELVVNILYYRVIEGQTHFCMLKDAQMTLALNEPE